MAPTATNAWTGRSARLILAAALMFGLAAAGIELTRHSDRIASVWLANGAVLAVLLRSERREWPVLGLVCLAANITANMISGDALPTAIALSLCNLIEIGLMARLIARNDGRGFLDDTQSIFQFAIFAGLAPILSGALAAFILAPSLDLATVKLFGQWYLADLLGLLMVTPLVLAWTQGWRVPSSWRALAEPAAFAVATVALSVVIFTGHAPRLFLLCPILLFAGFRLAIPMAAAIAALSAAIATGFTLQGMGPIAFAASTPEGQVLLLQSYFAVALLLTIPVSAINRERDRLQSALTTSERQFRLMAEASPAGILQCRLDGTPHFLNGRWTALTGTTLDDLRANGWEAVVDEGCRGRATALWNQVRGRIVEDSDCLPCHIVGRAVGWAEIFVTPERDSSGTVVGWVVRLMDVTDRIEAVQTLKERESLYRLLADNSRDMIMRIGLDGKCLFVSAAASAMIGKSPDDLIGTMIADSIHPDERLLVEHGLLTLADGTMEWTARYRQQRGNGQYLWVEAVYRLVRDPGTTMPLEIVASVRDIDLRQKAELIATEAALKLRERNRLLTMAEEMAGVGHWQFDEIDRTISVSSQAASIADVRRSDAMTPAAAMALVAPADRWRVKRALVAAVQGKPKVNCQVRVVRGDGSDRIIDFAVQAEKRDSHGLVSGVFGVVHDISRKVADERLLVEALEKANEAANAKSSFLATMSHEIRTPMTGVIGMIDLLRDNPSDAERASFLDTLKQSATVLMSVINDVLDFSKMEHGRLEIKKVDFDFEALAQSTLDLFFNAASQKGLLITLALDSGASPFVHGDPVRIQQVMSNLVNNAIKFTDAGSVVVRVKARPAAGTRQIWRVEVRDTGIGVPDDQAASLFDPFTQAEQGTGRRFGGTGLGLAISRQLVEGMGGEMGFTSNGQKGSNFWFEIALDEAHAQPAPIQKKRDSIQPERSLRVLVAEDNPVNQLLVTALLRRQGHQPTCVCDGQQAVDAARVGHFDCILMDMQMPVMDGITATRTIRQSASLCADVPIIALTADASPERRRFYDNAGLTDFMTKPIDGHALAARLAAIAAVPAASDVQQSALDEDHLGRLRAALGPKRLRSLLDLFLTDLGERPDHIRDHLLAGRLDQATSEAHSLKGAALSIGAGPLAEAAYAIEQLTSDTDIKTNARLLENLEDAVVAVRAALTEPEAEVVAGASLS